MIEIIDHKGLTHHLTLAHVVRLSPLYSFGANPEWQGTEIHLIGGQVIRSNQTQEELMFGPPDRAFEALRRLRNDLVSCETSAEGYEEHYNILHDAVLDALKEGGVSYAP